MPASFEQVPAPDGEELVVAHAPTDRDVKGTAHVIAAVEALRAGGSEHPSRPHRARDPRRGAGPARRSRSRRRPARAGLVRRGGRRSDGPGPSGARVHPRGRGGGQPVWLEAPDRTNDVRDAGGGPPWSRCRPGRAARSRRRRTAVRGGGARSAPDRPHRAGRSGPDPGEAATPASERALSARAPR